MSLNIDKTIRGDAIRYANCNNGLKQDRIKCDRWLILGDVYYISEMTVYSWNTDIELMGIPGVRFNSVMFDNIATFEI